jgi:hypothetical protein
MIVTSIAWFKQEIKQIDIIIGGVINKEYRIYLTEKRDIYEDAVRALERDEDNGI